MKSIAAATVPLSIFPLFDFDNFDLVSFIH